MVKEGTANAKAQRPERLCVFCDQTGCVCGYYPHSYWETPERVLCSFSTKLGFRSPEKRNMQPATVPFPARSGPEWRGELLPTFGNIPL